MKGVPNAAVSASFLHLVHYHQYCHICPYTFYFNLLPLSSILCFQSRSNLIRSEGPRCLSHHSFFLKKYIFLLFSRAHMTLARFFHSHNGVLVKCHCLYLYIVGLAKLTLHILRRDRYSAALVFLSSFFCNIQHCIMYKCSYADVSLSYQCTRKAKAPLPLLTSAIRLSSFI